MTHPLPQVVLTFRPIILSAFDCERQNKIKCRAKNGANAENRPSHGSNRGANDVLHYMMAGRRKEIHAVMYALALLSVGLLALEHGKFW